MNNHHLVIGSAGHVDHGKSSIIKALTNIDPTRLKDEKERNITIDLGFSYFELNNQQIGIVDLPGHERFVSNMIVGSSNIDMILFVIACDDGIMPQTVEHFEILSLLKIKHAIIILNKIDVVDQATIIQRKKEIAEFFEKSTFETAPIVETSIHIPETIKNLKTVLTTYILENNFEHRRIDIFRMAIDRSFTMKGQGCVVTGTSQGKDLSVLETLQIYPSNKLVKVKSIQNHNVNVDTISAGHRSALLLSNITKNEIKRGDIIATENSLFPARFLDVKINVLKSSKAIKNNQLIRIFHQTKEYIGRIKLPNCSVLPGKQSYATIILQDNIFALKNDLAIVRFYSPIKTIAGIEILNMFNKKPKITKEYYDRYTDSSLTKQIETYLKDHYFANLHQLKSVTPDSQNFTEKIDDLLKSNFLVNFSYKNKENYILKENFDILKSDLIKSVQNYHEHNPISYGMPVNSLYKPYQSIMNLKVFKSILANMKDLVLNQDLVSMREFKLQYSIEQKNRMNGIITYLKNSGYQLLTFDELNEKFNLKDDQMIIKNMLYNKQILTIQCNYVILDRMYTQLFKILNDVTKDNKIFLADFKASTNISRKYCLIILEHFDHIKVTKRVDDYRIILKKENM